MPSQTADQTMLCIVVFESSEHTDSKQKTNLEFGEP